MYGSKIVSYSSALMKIVAEALGESYICAEQCNTTVQIAQ